MTESDSKTLPARRRGRPRQGGEDGRAAALSPGDPAAAVGTLARGLAILRCFRADDQVIGTQEIARRTALPKATVSRLAGTLTELGYLRFVPEVGKFALSSQVLTLGFAALGRTGIAEIARPFMVELASSGDCAVALSIRDQLDMIFIELIRKPQAITLNLTAGAHIPLLLSAPGRAYLAAIDETERESIFRQFAAREGAAWPAQLAPLEESLALARRQGFSESMGAWRQEHNAIGTVLREATTGEIYTLSLGGLASNLSRDKLVKDFAPRLLAAAEAIGSRLSGLG